MDTNSTISIIPGNLAEFPPLVTTREAATILRVDNETVRRLLVQKKLPGIKIGGSWRIKRDDLFAILNGQQTHAV